MIDRYRWRLWPTLTVLAALALTLAAVVSPTVRAVVGWCIGVSAIVSGLVLVAGYRHQTIRKAQRRRVR